MTQDSIFIPFLGMMLLTFIVWIYMFIQRLVHMTASNIDPQEAISPDKFNAMVPDKVAAPGHNFRNLVELPLLFYGLCIYLYLTSQVDSGYLYAAYIFLGFRVLHSLIQCSFNNVNLRFSAYIVASIALWYILIRSIINALSLMG
ncbi:MAPEG family protein [Endozoicomonas arenosclerae]|uniref:MAPEG family protein n=1 Tax=Endozoicomonas arenosclerae TaxID=1633495 RepID=UPI00156097ED|nr:MAPEG family protein [Endozoicomonas arenosclerae]